MVIDGEASTTMTRWDGTQRSLDWTRRDVTSLPYHLRRGGDAAIIGVGGGRDILTALWGEHTSVTGIEINRAFVDLLRGPLREFAGLAPHPAVHLVYDEARSYLTRTPDRYDVLQMALIDTWASTGAGAFTLSENGLYTLEAWDIFLGCLKPGGILSVSRWYSPANVSETTRLVALASASLLRRGLSNPSTSLILVSRANVATLLVSPDPFSQSDTQLVNQVSEELGFRVLLGPDTDPADLLLGQIASARSISQIIHQVEKQPYDFTPPTDERPYFFNIIKPSQLVSLDTGPAP